MLLALVCSYSSLCQIKHRVTHVSGDSLVACFKISVSSSGVVDRNMNGCPETGPYNIGYNFTTRISGNGSYTYNFTPPVDSLTLNISGISYLDWGKELVRLYVNGQHYSNLFGTKLSCDPLAVLTSDGDITGCYPCGASGLGNITIRGSISTLTILDSCSWGYGNGVKVSLDIYGNPTQLNNFSLGLDSTLCNGEEILLNAMMPFSSYLWQDGSTNSTFTVKKEGTYWVTVTDTCGSIKDTIKIKYKNCNNNVISSCNIQLPNAFTPNNDGTNDKFPALYTCNFSYFELKIFNIWGEMIFQSIRSSDLWDGKYKGVLQAAGVYVYQLSYSLSSGEKEIKSGTVLLIK